MLLALEDLHKRNIIFRDLKPENVVIDREGHAKLTDFGLSKEGITDETLTRTVCGSKFYLAPEIISKEAHDKSLDWYLFGVMTYEVLVGTPPYYSKNRLQFLKNVKEGSLEPPKTMSNEAKDLITRLLNRNPSNRLKPKDIKRHPWFNDIDWDIALRRELNPPKPIIKPIEQEVLDIFPDNEKGYDKVRNWTYVKPNTNC